MHSTRIIAIRHGETQWNALRQLQGHRDIALNARGRAQAQALASALTDGGQGHPLPESSAIAVVYSSDLQRAFETGRALARAAGAPLVAEPALRERSFGVWEGRSFADLSVEFPQEALRWRKRDPTWAPPGSGENLRDFQTRVSAVVQRLAAAHLGEQIAIITHGGVLDCLYRLATGLDIQAPRTWELGNATINRLLWAPQGGLTLVGWNDARHLEESLNLDIGEDAP